MWIFWPAILSCQDLRLQSLNSGNGSNTSCLFSEEVFLVMILEKIPPSQAQPLQSAPQLLLPRIRLDIVVVSSYYTYHVIHIDSYCLLHLSPRGRIRRKIHQRFQEWNMEYNEKVRMLTLNTIQSVFTPEGVQSCLLTMVFTTVHPTPADRSALCPARLPEAALWWDHSCLIYIMNFSHR